MHRFSPNFALRPAAVIACAAAIVSLSGCAGISGSAVSSSLTTTIPAGSVHGGQQPIQGARIYVFKASTTGYVNPSTSLIATGDGNDSTGNYILTKADGSFNYGGQVTCSPSDQIYLLALGGNATGFQNAGNTPTNDNAAIALGAALGSCSGILPTTFTSINEVTTVAMAYALNAFVTDATHISTSPTNTIGLSRAFTMASKLVDNSTGTAQVGNPVSGLLPQKKINSIANAIATCVNSGSATSIYCTQLQARSGATAADTLSAVIAMAQNPSFNPAGVYNISSGVVPFQPALTSAPDDLSLGITYKPTATTLTGLGSLAIDPNGNIWVTNCASCAAAPTAADSLVEFAPDGTYTGTFTANGHIHNPKGIAIDANGTYIYSTNQAISGGTATTDEVTKMLVSTGGYFASSGANATDFGTGSLAGITVDNTGNLWVSAGVSSNVLEFSPALAEINGSPYTPADGILGPSGIATDKTGLVWVGGYASNNLANFSSAGAFTGPFTPTGLSQPQAISIDGSSNIWSVNTANNTVSSITSAGANATGSPFANIGIYDAVISAIDGGNHVLITDCRNGCNVSNGSTVINSTGSVAPDNLLKLNQNGSVANGSNPGTYGVEIDGGFTAPSGLAIDVSGNVWVANNGTQTFSGSTEVPTAGSGYISEVIGYASPTVQPLAAAVLNGTIGTRP